MALTDTLIRNTKPTEKQFKLADGKGMFLLVMPSGAKYWRLKYYHMKKEKILALGVYPEVTLKEAREKCEQARKIVQSGKDPVQTKEEEKRQALIAEAHSFEAIAREWYENKKANWKPKYANNLMRRLELNVFPHIGRRPITAITASELLSVMG